MNAFLSKWLWSIWLLVLGSMCVQANVFSAFAYDGRANTTISYDAGSTNLLNYDGKFVFSENDMQGRSAAARALFRQFANFLAAEETTATQLEFPFARGASIQTPGVTTEGETFVRVGAGPQNLKFGSTSLSGAQPGTYAFPQATFDAIGQDPAALKNFGDLPGTAPQYFRTLQPPPGTLIQRGIVPGGEFGGVGGAQEVIFPKGF